MPRREYPRGDFEFLADFTENRADVSQGLIEAVESALAALSPRELEVVRAVVYEGMSLAQVAEDLGLTKSTVQTYWDRARMKLMLGLHGQLEEVQ